MHYRLDALNFLLADVRGGLGAFVSVFPLTEAHWTPAQIGALGGVYRYHARQARIKPSHPGERVAAVRALVAMGLRGK